MIRTRAEAEAHRYGQWAGNPSGYAYDPKRCAYGISGKFIEGQCQHRPKYGPDAAFCGIHAKIVERRRA